jgi:hypothetical protein
VLALLASAAAARADVTLDPNVAGQGTALVVGADSPAPGAIVAALPRGTRVDTAAVRQLCGRSQAARGTCPRESLIGAGRYVVALDGFLMPGGHTEVAWAMNAYLGTPAQRGDVASVVLSATLLAADSVAELLVPQLGTSVPAVATTTGRLVRRTSGAYGFELRFPGLPVQLQVAAPTTATPARLEFGLSAVRRIRKDFVRRIKVMTPSGSYEIQKIPDHRLVGHDLFRAPRTCSGSWPVELRIGTQRSTARVPCLQNP